MALFTNKDILEMPGRFRANFCNSLVGYKTLGLVGTQNKDGAENLAIFSQLIHIGANPPLFGILFLPHTVRRDTLENIVETKSYTINHVAKSFYKKAHQSGAKYDRGHSEFKAVGLNSEYLKNHPTPFVQEAQVKIGLNFQSRIDIEANGTILIIGEVQLVETNEEHIKPDGFIDQVANETVLGSGQDAYYTANKLARLSYPQPESNPTELEEF